MKLEATTVMKRVKQSGASFRKKKKAVEEESKKNEGALLKFIQRTSSPTNKVMDTEDDNPIETGDKFDIANATIEVDTATVEGEGDIDAEVCEREIEPQEMQQLITLKTDFVSDFTDIGLWQVKICHEIWAMLVRQGYTSM